MRTLCQTADVTDRESIDVLARRRPRSIRTRRYSGERRRLYVQAADRRRCREEQWSSLIDTNLNGALRACQCFYEPLKASGRGRIINIASLGSFLAFHEVAAYCAAKTALLSLTRSLACEWARDGIRSTPSRPASFRPS